jgi:hypothetical protein
MKQAKFPPQEFVELLAERRPRVARTVAVVLSPTAV